jgi:opacity protein-like surface antigen
MKRLLQVVGVAALAAAPMVAGAQEATKTIGFGVSGGLSQPMGDFADAFKTGFGVAGHVYFMPAGMPNLAIRGNVGVDRFAAKSDDELEGLDANFRSLSGGADVMYRLPTSGGVRPYLLAGVGLSSGKVTISGDGASLSSDATNKLTFGGGAGLEFKLSGFSTFAEVRYVSRMKDDGDESGINWVPVVFGVKF